MSREIKFRVWVKKRKGYRELDQLVFDNQGLEEVWAFPKDDETQQVYHPSEVVAEQYTGLKDKNGKEVYEGDIIKYDGLSYAVEWSERYASFETVDLRDGFIGSPSLHFIAGLGSVIGNIHENLGGEDVGV